MSSERKISSAWPLAGSRSGWRHRLRSAHLPSPRQRVPLPLPEPPGAGRGAANEPAPMSPIRAPSATKDLRSRRLARSRRRQDPGTPAERRTPGSRRSRPVKTEYASAAWSTENRCVVRRRHLHPAARDELQKRLEVPLLRPADVTGWQVATPLLVLAVVASRAVRAREPQLELLSVESFAVGRNGDVADDDEAASVACQPRRERRPDQPIVHPRR